MAQRQPGVQYFVEHHGSHLFIMTNATLDEFIRGAQPADTASDARSSVVEGRSSATAYQAAPCDRAEDISFSRWSSTDWESTDVSPQASVNPLKDRPPALYQEGAADRAEDISFSRWSPAAWEAKTSAAIVNDGGSPQQRQVPTTAYQAGPADQAEDISFSRWSPVSWETDGMLTDGGGLQGGDAAEYRLLRMPVVDGVPSR